MIVTVTSESSQYAFDLDKVTFLQRCFDDNTLQIYFIGDEEPLVINWSDGEKIWNTWTTRAKFLHFDEAGGAGQFLNLDHVHYACTFDGGIAVHSIGDSEGVLFRGDTAFLVRQKLLEHSLTVAP